MKLEVSSFRWRKAAAIAVATAMSLSMFGLGAHTANADEASNKVVVSQVAKNGDKGYLEVDGKPFLMHGVQFFGEWQTFGSDKDSIPTNQKNRVLPQDWLENGFEKTKAAGFDTIQIELAWNQIQPTAEGEYDWTLLDKYVQWAKKYDLKIDIVWWGTNGCGGGIRENTVHGFMADIPDYLEDDKYWGQKNNGDENEIPYLPNDSDPNIAANADYLFGEERKAVNAMFDHLADVDTSHQTILFQIWNELNWNGWKDGHGKAQKSEWLRLADELGKAVKTADYVVATRLNYRGNSIDARSVLDQYEYIDFSGPDAYTKSLSSMANIVKDTAKKSDIAYIPETFSGNNNLSGVTATVLASGGFVDFWQLNESWAGRDYSLYGIPDDGYPEYTTWKIGTIPAMPAETQKLTRLNTGLNKISQLVAAALPENMTSFNTDADAPVKGYTGTQSIAGQNIVFSNAADADAIGFAVRDANTGDIYVASDADGRTTVNLGHYAIASVGSFDASGKWTGETRDTSANGDITLNAGEAVRVVPITDLRLAVDAAYGLKSSDYTADSWKTFEKAYANAKSTLADTSVTAKQAASAAADLISAQQALVVTGKLTITDPASVTVASGTALADVQAQAPSTVNARAGASKAETIPVVWDWSGVDAAITDSVTVHGTATTADGDALPAMLHVLIGAKLGTNIASADQFSATYAESKKFDTTFDGKVGNKGWTTWGDKTDTKTTPTGTLTFDGAKEIGEIKIYYYKDGNGTWPATVVAEYQDASSGEWKSFGDTVTLPDTADTAPTADFNIAEPVKATAVRVVNNLADTNVHPYISVSEIEAYEMNRVAPSSDATLADLRVDGASINGFDPAATEYDGALAGDAESYPLVQAFARDTAATVSLVQPSADNDGVATVTVESAAGDATSTYTINFGKLPQLTGLKIVTDPSKNIYKPGEALSLDGLRVEAVWTRDGEVTAQPAVDVKNLSISGFDSSSEGSKVVTVSYRGQSATFTVTVAKDSSSQPTKPGAGATNIDGHGQHGQKQDVNQQSGNEALSNTGVSVGSIAAVAVLLACAGLACAVRRSRR